MDPFQFNQTKKPTPKSTLIDTNPIEQVKGIASSVVDSAKNDLVTGVARNVVNQIFGGQKAASMNIPQSSEIKPNTSINFNEKAVRKDERMKVEFLKRQTEGQVFNSRDIEVTQEIQQIQCEIKRIIAGSQEIKNSVTQAIVQPLPERPGEYHLSFFSFILRLLKDAREKVEESTTWLAMFSTKKKSRNYWSMFKKHGTGFGLSNERSVATQSG